MTRRKHLGFIAAEVFGGLKLRRLQFLAVFCAGAGAAGQGNASGSHWG